MHDVIYTFGLASAVSFVLVQVGSVSPKIRRDRCKSKSSRKKTRPSTIVITSAVLTMYRWRQDSNVLTFRSFSCRMTRRKSRRASRYVWVTGPKWESLCKQSTTRIWPIVLFSRRSSKSARYPSLQRVLSIPHRKLLAVENISNTIVFVATVD